MKMHRCPAHVRGTVPNTMNTYELMYIVPTSLTEEAVGKVESDVAALLTKHGATVTKTTRLGKLRFAYSLKRERHGHYVLVRFTSEPSAVAAVNEGLRLTMDQVLRHLILTAEEAGEEKFDLVQFQEVVVDGKDERARRAARPGKPVTEKVQSADQKAAVATLEEAGEEKSTAPVDMLSAEELQKKIDAALTENA
jgi:small subunit ribosomal protein S6